MNLVQLIAWAEDTCIGLTLRFLIVSLTLISLFSPNDENLQLETLGEEFELAGNIWWGEYTILWVLGQQDALALWGQWPYLLILFVWEFVWWDVSVLWGQYLHHRHRDLQIRHLILDYVFYCFKECRCSSTTLIIAYKDNIVLPRFCLKPYTVDWLLQWSKDYSDTTVSGWPTLWMSNRAFYSTLRFEAMRCYLYAENWFGDETFCFDYVLYSEEGCTEYLVWTTSFLRS